MNAVAPLSGAHWSPVVKWLGRVPYEPTWRAMQSFTDTRTPDTPDELWLLEHDPVYTLGMNADRSHVLATGDIPVVQIDRGGQVTYHGPGQLVVYPLFDVRRLGLGVRELVTALERAVIDYAARFGIVAECRANAPGVYVAGAKLAANEERTVALVQPDVIAVPPCALTPPDLSVYDACLEAVGGGR